MVSRLAAAEAVDSPCRYTIMNVGGDLHFLSHLLSVSMYARYDGNKGVLILSLLPKPDPHCWGRQSVKHKSSNKCIYAVHDQRQLCIVVQATSINQYFNNNICNLAPSSSSLHISMRISAALNWCS